MNDLIQFALALPHTVQMTIAGIVVLIFAGLIFASWYGKRRCDSK